MGLQEGHAPKIDLTDNSPPPLSPRALLHQLRIGGVRRAYADRVGEESHNSYLSILRRRYGEGVRQSGIPHVCFERLRGRRMCPDIRQTYHQRWECRPDGLALDHLAEFRRGDETVAIVSQPYGLSPEALVASVKYCESRGLRMRVCADESWHYPGWTLLVEFTNPAVTEVR